MLCIKNVWSSGRVAGGEGRIKGGEGNRAGESGREEIMIEEARRCGTVRGGRGGRLREG